MKNIIKILLLLLIALLFINPLALLSAEDDQLFGGSKDNESELNKKASKNSI